MKNDGTCAHAWVPSAVYRDNSILLSNKLNLFFVPEDVALRSL